MGNTFVISGLKQKRARIDGELRALQRSVVQRTEERNMPDSGIHMFEPDCNPDMIAPIRPGSHGLFFSYREIPRLMLDYMRKAAKPIRLEPLTEYMIAAKGLTPDECARKRIRHNIRQALTRLEQRGLIRRILEEPDMWWELVP